MRSRLYCSRAAQRQAIEMKNQTIASAILLVTSAVLPVCASADAPAWMHNLVNAPVPAHDEKTDAAVMYSEEIVTVQSMDKVKRTVRKAYKILRPNGREHGLVLVTF